MDPKQIMVMEYIASKNRHIQLVGQKSFIEFDAITELGIYGLAMFKNA